MTTTKNFKQNVIVAIIFVGLAYTILSFSSHPAKTDLITEGLLFLFAGFIGFRGYRNKTGRKTKQFRKFELFYGLTYSIVAIACVLGVVFFFNNPAIHDIDVAIVKESKLLQAMSAIKSTSFVFMFLAWFYFYKNLNIQARPMKKIIAFLIGFGGYFGASLFILAITGDTSIISLGIIVGAAIGLFAMIALHRSTRYLTIIFLLFSIVHLWEFYLMGMGKDLVTGLNNPIYWLIILLYALEVNNWIQYKQYKLNNES